MAHIPPKATFDFRRKVAPVLREIRSGESPRELLLNSLQLKQWGWEVAFSDSRWSGPWVGFRRRVARYTELPDIQAFRDWRSSSVVVIASRTPLLLILLQD